MEKKFKILGFADDYCVCEVCGKQELKGTYALEDLKNGGIIRAGSTCGRRMAGWTTREFKAAVKERKDEILAQARKEFQGTKEYQSFENAIAEINARDEAFTVAVCRARTQAERDELVRQQDGLWLERKTIFKALGVPCAEKRREILEKYKLSNYESIG